MSGPQPFETLEQFAVRYYRRKIAESLRDTAVNLTIAAAMWAAGFAR